MNLAEFQATRHELPSLEFFNEQDELEDLYDPEFPTVQVYHDDFWIKGPNADGEYELLLDNDLWHDKVLENLERILFDLIEVEGFF